jgi:Zn-finger protein
MKAMVTMTEWELYVYEARNTMYVCPLKYMTVKPYKDVVRPYIEELSKLAKKSDGALEQIVSASACMALGEKNAMAEYIGKLQEVGQQELHEKERKENQKLFPLFSKRNF